MLHRTAIAFGLVLLVLSGCGKPSKQSSAHHDAAPPDQVTEADVRQCVADIYARTNMCSNYLTVDNVAITARRSENGVAMVIAHLNLRATRKFYKGGISGLESDWVTNHCTGTGWTNNNGTTDILPGETLVIDKRFVFEKFDTGWRCATASIPPIVGQPGG